ncbi:PREDICTED: phenazine biosynthesis-like domain-containing protein [Branchiostoma belcheri]|uniref:Phenazine biosynthesis-like domain-containing protein n=1 Tax=Branchiostoma belcheri TaxID=7741 RepID=A0A6P4XU67_BRABE|nr:PREDICTED: phenazine biosynthesis-like domain-containing protein [Branchiostoma belcheri]
MADFDVKKLPIFQVDAFTDEPFAGNPAAVCLLEDVDLTNEHQQKIAAEMNLSETAYIRKLNLEDDFSSSSKFGLRWFTPTNEVALCGHATLASAATLFYMMKNPSPQLTFQTLSGDLFARRDGDFISLDLPENKTQPQDREPYSQLLQAVVDTTPIRDLRYCRSIGGDVLVRLTDDTTRQTLESLRPDTAAMLAAHTQDIIRGVIVTVKGSPENGCVDNQGVMYDFISRYFAPWNGIPEDPVTGSAHTVLASYWAEELGKTQFYARQCSARGGDLKVRLREDGRVDVAGKAAVVVQGMIRI